MYKKIIYLLSLIFFLTSCETMGSIKRGLTGEKVQSTDEFLVQKKNPLIMPPDFDKLPKPGTLEEKILDEESESKEIKNLLNLKQENKKENTSKNNNTDIETSILKKIK